MSMRRTALRWILLPLLGGCSDDGPSGSSDADASDSASTTAPTGGATSDTEATAGTTHAADQAAPEIRDLRVSVAGGPVLDLNDADLRRILPDPTPIEFTIRARDDVTADEDLTISVHDVESDVTAASIDSAFVNGLWRVTVVAETGFTYRVRVTDEVGNATTSDHGVEVPVLAEAILGRWDRYEYGSRTIEEVMRLELRADGTWTETARIGTLERAGTWVLEDARLTLDETTRTGGEGPMDTDPETAEVGLRGAVYVDDAYLDARPWVAVDGQTNEVAGAWMRTYVERAPPTEGAALEDARDVEEMLTLGSGGSFTLARTVTPASGAPAQSQEAGTWSVEINGEYFANFGDFLVLLTDEIDGEPVEPREVWNLHRARAGRLLIGPHVWVSQ
jgi:hypothetical protein